MLLHGCMCKHFTRCVYIVAAKWWYRLCMCAAIKTKEKSAHTHQVYRYVAPYLYIKSIMCQYFSSVLHLLLQIRRFLLFWHICSALRSHFPYMLALFCYSIYSVSEEESCNSFVEQQLLRMCWMMYFEYFTHWIWKMGRKLWKKKTCKHNHCQYIPIANALRIIFWHPHTRTQWIWWNATRQRSMCLWSHLMPSKLFRYEVKPKSLNQKRSKWNINKWK